MAAIDGTSGNDTLDGTSGDDTITGFSGDDTIKGLAGNDTIYGDDPADGATGGDDVIYGGDGNDVIDGGRGSNILDGGPGDDVISAGYGANQIIGGPGNDILQGAQSDDIFIIADAADHVVAEIGDFPQGGGGFDRVYFTATTPGTLTLFAGDTGIEEVDICDSSGDLHGTVALNVDASAVAGRLFIEGNNGPNELRASAGTSYIEGNGGNDTLIGSAGADTLDGGAGADRLIGGAGNDLYIIRGAGDVIVENADEGWDFVLINRSYVFDANVEQVQFEGNGNFNATGNDIDNAIGDTAGDNILRGMGGNDTLSSSSGNDILEGGEGNDVLSGGTGITEASYVSATAGVRVNLSVHHYQDTLGAGVDTLYNIDNLNGSAFADILKGDVGTNVLIGNGGDDRLFGAEGNDTLTGSSGYDRLYGGTGDDTFYVNDTTDFAYELPGEGIDTVIASVSVRLRDNVENLTLVDTAYIGKGNGLDNVIIAHDLGTKLYGFDGNDDLEGGAGQDFLNGGSGSDIIRGGAARDIMTGGDGNDLFVFADGEFGGLSTWTADRITDFASGDRVDLSAVDANTLLASDQAFSFIGTSSFTGTAGELRYEDISGSTYITGDTDGDGHADFVIKLDGLHALAAADLVL